MRYLPKSPADREAMLKAIGARSIDDLFAPIPAEYRLNRDLFRLLYAKGGPRLAVGGFFLQQLYYLYSLLGLALGIAIYFAGSHSRRHDHALNQT